MKRKKHAILAPFVSLLFLVVAVSMATSRAQDQQTAAEIVTDYLQRDIFLQPGVGLKTVKIGMEFEKVRDVWGPPSDEGRDKIVNKKWIYQIAEHTTITLIGNRDVEVMRVTGEFNSPYTTSEGASFGMARHQLATIYGPGSVNNNKVSYGSRGIGFLLERGQVSEIRVFAAAN